MRDDRDAMERAFGPPPLGLDDYVKMASKTLDEVAGSLVEIEAKTHSINEEITRVTNSRLAKIEEYTAPIGSVAWIQIVLLGLILWRVW